MNTAVAVTAIICATVALSLALFAAERVAIRVIPQLRIAAPAKALAPIEPAVSVTTIEREAGAA